MTADGPGHALPPSSAFADDDGSAPAALAATTHLTDRQERLEAVVEALRTTRVLVPVVARLDERAEPAEPGQIVGEKSAHTAMVTVQAPDGRAALPVFSSMAALQAWRAEARPVPVTGPRAALAAETEADGVLVLDPGSGPVQVPRPALRAIALGLPWVPAARHPDVEREVNAVLQQVPGVRGAEIEPGAQTEICAVVHLQRHPAVAPDPATIATLRACQQALATSQVLVDLVDTIAVRPATRR